jgi:hypothetical protein
VGRIADAFGKCGDLIIGERGARMIELEQV